MSVNTYRTTGVCRWADYVGTIACRVIEASKSAGLLAASNGRYMTQFENNLRGVGLSNIEGQTREDFIGWFVDAHDYVVTQADNGVDTLLASYPDVRGPPPPPSLAARPHVTVVPNTGLGLVLVSSNNVLFEVKSGSTIAAGTLIARLRGYGMVGQEFYGTEKIILDNVTIPSDTLDDNYVRKDMKRIIEVTTATAFNGGSFIEVGFNNLWLGTRGGITAWLGAQCVLKVEWW